jgi:hypothetical protein
MVFMNTKTSCKEKINKIIENNWEELLNKFFVYISFQ